jgi:hypothetical protein
LLIVLIMLSACGFLAPGADPPKKGNAFHEAFPLLVKQSASVIEESLAGEPTRRAAEKARVAALMLAACAQQDLAGPEAAKWATQRDAALDIAVMIKEKKYPDAIAHAKRLPNLMVNATAKKEKVKLFGTHLEIDELMSQFRGAKVGGLGIETTLDKLGGSKDGVIAKNQLNEELALIAFRTAVAAELTREHMPPKDGKEWLGYADDMRASSLELAKAVDDGNGKAAHAAVERLNNSCNKCHLKFR